MSRNNRWDLISRIIKLGVTPPFEYLLNCSDVEVAEFNIVTKEWGKGG